MFTISKTDVNLEICKEYKNVEVEVITKKDCFTRTVDAVWVEPFEEDSFVIKMANKYFCGANSAGDKIYKIEDGEKELLNKN